MLLKPPVSLRRRTRICRRNNMVKHAQRWNASKFIPFRPTRARGALMLAGVLVAAGAYGLVGLCGQLRMDVMHTGSCTVATVTHVSREHLTVELDSGTQVGLYGYGRDLTEGAPLRVCVSKDGTWADARGHSSNWLLTSEPSVFPAAAAGVLMFLALYAGDGIRIGCRDED
ncbi:hypothetical protein [Dactylosporangium sp. NPDC048998]|uniref:hypothetical protein n=1 Tax=Dactylosporangium sp. NPDC048998 TaxID=3363976 RepID=UPI00370F7F82